MNLANTLTVLRILLVPVLVWLLAQGAYGSALWVFLAAGLSDALDGFVARRFNQMTRVGAILDPVADKLIIISAVVALAWVRLVPLPLVLLVIARDVVIVGGAVCYRLLVGSVEMSPTRLSKFNTFAQLAMILTVLAQAAGLVEVPVLPFVYGLVVITTVASAVQYVWIWGRKAARCGGASS
jgi:cardiolipin synthase